MNKINLYYIYIILIFIFSIYVLLDTFVISRKYIKIDNYDSNIVVDKSKFTIDSYNDDNIKIELVQYRENNTTIYVADIRLSDASYLKTAFANSYYGKNVVAKTSDIAKSKNAILAINGDFYGVREKGYVLRNGIIYRSILAKNQEDLAIYRNGNFEIFNEHEYDLKELLNNNVYNVLSFGPGLLKNNEIIVGENEEVKLANIKNPRTAIGIIKDLHYVFVVSDARTRKSKGLTLYELAKMGNIRNRIRWWKNNRKSKWNL